jgi:hypothetical protein
MGVNTMGLPRQGQHFKMIMQWEREKALTRQGGGDSPYIM